MARRGFSFRASHHARPTATVPGGANSWRNSSSPPAKPARGAAGRTLLPGDLLLGSGVGSRRPSWRGVVSLAELRATRKPRQPHPSMELRPAAGICTWMLILSVCTLLCPGKAPLVQQKSVCVCVCVCVYVCMCVCYVCVWIEQKLP
mmetsp:Transcript_39927/g.113233  ORF Transcript_39927/g.113233 Transcript_39927/m.113233 type:complete len:147 (-) Transcript_39927:113-553(-)